MAELTPLDKSQYIAQVQRLRRNNDPITSPVMLLGAITTHMTEDDLNPENTIVVETDKLPNAQELGEKLAAIAQKYPNANLRSIAVFSDGDTKPHHTRDMYKNGAVFQYAEEFIQSVEQYYKPEYRTVADYDRALEARNAAAQATKLKNG